jgi:pyridinium-3,5-bisthiocarboxylic acid mononucleotide nickel chelatase
LNAYLDLANGVSGDMLLAAIAHAGRRLGVDAEQAIAEAIGSLGLGCTVSFVDDERGGMACLRAEVKTDGASHTPARMREAIEGSRAPAPAKERAISAIDALVEAESRVHGTVPEDVHLHELGSADTAADVLGAAAGFHALGVDEVSTAPVPVPRGWISSDHGPLPLPAPATLELLEGAALTGVDSDIELVTPTGVAILVAHEAAIGAPVDLVLRAVGIGGGTKVTDRPNICRLLVGDSPAPQVAPTETCVLLEANIDDQTPQSLAHATETLLAEGALDAWITPIVMKKSRPAFLLSVLAKLSDESPLAEKVFRLTTTIGLRRRAVTRYALDRQFVTVEVEGHEIRVKVARMNGEATNVAAEFDDCVAASEVTGLRPAEIAARAEAEARSQLDSRA